MILFNFDVSGILVYREQYVYENQLDEFAGRGCRRQRFVGSPLPPSQRGAQGGDYRGKAADEDFFFLSIIFVPIKMITNPCMIRTIS